MSSAEIKLNIFRLIDQIEDDDQLTAAYKKLLALLNPGTTSDSLFKDPEESIQISLRQISEGKSIPHEEVMAKYRNKFSTEE